MLDEVERKNVHLQSWRKYHANGTEIHTSRFRGDGNCWQRSNRYCDPTGRNPFHQQPTTSHIYAFAATSYPQSSLSELALCLDTSHLLEWSMKHGRELSIVTVHGQVQQARWTLVAKARLKAGTESGTLEQSNNSLFPRTPRCPTS